MSAPMHGPLRPHHFRFTLGAVEVTTILDGAIPMGISPPFLLEESGDEIAAIATAARLPTDRLENNFVPVLINTGAALVLIDTGCGHFRRDKGAGFLRDRLAGAGYAPEDIDVVMITHVHPDHIGGLLEDGDLAFPNARLMIGRREFDGWSDGTEIPEQRAENRQMFLDIVAPLKQQLRFLEDGDEIVPGVTAEAAFGHSVGHMMVRVRSGEAEVLIWGDVANHAVFSLEHPDSKVGFDDNKALAIATRNRVLADAADHGLLVVGHHMPFPGVGYVLRGRDGYHWRPVSYQPFL